MEVLGISLAIMGVISVAIFKLAIGGDVSVAMEGGHVKAFKGEEYEAVLTIQSRASDWIGSTSPTVNVETSQLVKTEPLAEGRIRLHFLGTYAGRSESVKIGIWLTDPLKLLRRLKQIAYNEFVIDMFPLSLLAPTVPRRLTIFGSGDQTIGYPGPGQELYGLNEYNLGDTKDIIWKRVANSPEEKLTTRVREANGKDSITVAVVQFVERGDDHAAWTDMLCEALGHAGKDVLEMGATFTILYHSSPKVKNQGTTWRGEDHSPELVRMSATDIVELAEAVMSCSVASPSREIERMVRDSDLVITGLRELEDEKMAMLISRKPMLLISDDAHGPSTFTQESMIYSGKEDLFPLIRKILER